MSNSGSLCVQVLVQGPEDEQFAEQLGAHLDAALVAANAGADEGSDFGSGAMNLFYGIRDRAAAHRLVSDLLEEVGDPRVVASFSVDEQEDVWWPKAYPFIFTAFGPAGVLPTATEPAMPALAGAWALETPQGKLTFLFGGGLMMVRAGFNTVSAARIRVLPGQNPTPVDLVPICGSARGMPSEALMQIDGNTLYFASGRPGDPRPEQIGGPGTMALERVP